MADATLNLVPSVGGGVSMDVMGNSSTAGVYLKNGPDSLKLPIISYDEEFADSPDTEGGKVVRSRPTRTVGSLDLWVNGKTTADLWNQFQLLEQTVEQCRRNKGKLTYTPKNGTAVTYNVETARISDLKQQDILIRAGRMECSVEFQFQPYGELAKIVGYPLTDLDPFNRDSISNQEWRFDSGAGTLIVSGGQLVPTSTATKLLYRALNVIDATAYIKMSIGVSAAFNTGIVLKRLDASNMLRVLSDGSNLYLIKIDAGGQTILNSTGWTGSAATSYWIKGTIVGNVFTANVYTTDPNGSSPTAPIKTVSTTLTGGDATKFGSGVKGNPGLLFSATAALDARWSGWRVDSSLMESFDPQANFELIGVPGSVEALAALNATDVSNQTRRHLEIGIDDRDYDKTQPQPTLIDSDTLQTSGLIGSPATHSGAGSAYDPGASVPNVISATLSTTYQGICSTGSQFHLGSRKIKARVYPAGTGPVYVRLAYRVGDGGWTRKDWVPVPNMGNFYELDLGSILLPDALASGQAWEGRIEAYSSTNGDTLEVDFIEVYPAKRWARAKAPSDIGVKSLLIQERFNQGVGNLSAASVGGGAAQVVTKNPAAFADDPIDGSVAWSNLSNVAAADGAEAVASSGSVAANFVYSHGLQATMSGGVFAIPGTATIKGIQIDVKRKVTTNSSNSGGNQKALDQRIQLRKAGAYVGSNYAAQGEEWPLTSTYKSYGGPSDLWGTTWTPTEINAASFGVGVAGVSFVLNPGLGIQQDWRIDHIRLTIYYTDAGVAGQWTAVTNSSANDITTTGSTAFQAQRTAVSDTANTGRAVVAGAGTYVDTGVAVTVLKTDQANAGSEYFRGGVIARQVGTLTTGSLLFCGFDFDLSVTPAIQRLAVYKNITGTWTRLGSVLIYGSLAGGRRVWLEADSAGNYFVWTGVPNQPVLVLTGNDTSLATSGTLQSGGVGIYDEKRGSTATTRNYDDFELWTPDWPSGVIIPNGTTVANEGSAYRQSGSDIALDGSYIRVNPAGKEGRGSQWVVKARRNDVDIQPDDQLSDILQLSVDITPRVALL